MRFLLILCVLTLAGCLPEKTLDTSTQQSLAESISDLRNSLAEQDKPVFDDSIKYFKMGGIGSISKKMAEAFGVESSIEAVSIDDLNGLTATQIIGKFNIEKEAIERRQKIQDLKAEARDLREAKKYSEALSVYSEIQDIDPAQVNGEIDSTKTEIENDAAAVDYIANVKIIGFSAKRIDTYANKNVPAVKWKLKNAGDKDLSKVKVIVYFRDPSDKVIYEESYHPVLVTKYSMSDKKPLKAGYVWELEADKYYTLDVPLSDWEEGNASAVVSEIEFAK